MTDLVDTLWVVSELNRLARVTADDKKPIPFSEYTRENEVNGYLAYEDESNEIVRQTCIFPGHHDIVTLEKDSIYALTCTFVENSYDWWIEVRFLGSDDSIVISDGIWEYA